MCDANFLFICVFEYSHHHYHHILFLSTTRQTFLASLHLLCQDPLDPLRDPQGLPDLLQAHLLDCLGLLEPPGSLGLLELRHPLFLL